MLKIKIIVVDRTRSPFLKEGEVFYLKRLKPFAHIEWIEVKPARIKKGWPIHEVLRIENKAITQRIGTRDYLVALDRKGNLYDSETLAQWLSQLSAQTKGWVCFIIGGPLGLSEELLKNSDTVLSLSRLTLTHEMSRILLLEQTYRAFTIMRGHKYHK
jgi:23S rRNA (pseudouridine1915-N3)-methyltransferase